MNRQGELVCTRAYTLTALLFHGILQARLCLLNARLLYANEATVVRTE